jgi:hypothetical protein
MFAAGTNQTLSNVRFCAAAGPQQTSNALHQSALIYEYTA